MRLLFSMAVLLILVCVVIETFAAKSNRDTDTRKDNYKPRNSKEVRYSKEKSDFNKKGNGKKNEVFQEKRQRRSTEGNDNVESSGVSRKNQNERNENVPNEERKRLQSNKQNKFGKTGGNFENNENIKFTKDAGKKQKRSIESEKLEERLNNDGIDSSPKNKKSQFNSASEKEAKKKFEKKSRGTFDKTADGEFESDTIVNIEGVSTDQPSKKSATSLDNNAKISRKNKNAKEHCIGSKKVKQQKHEDNLDLNKNGATISEEYPEVNTKSESLNNLPEEKARCVNLKKQKSSTKASDDNISECESQVNDCELLISKTEKPAAKKSEEYKSRSCNSEAKASTDGSRIHTKKSKHTRDRRNGEEDFKQLDEANDEDSENVDSTLTDENVYDEAENCMRAESVEENLIEENGSIE